VHCSAGVSRSAAVVLYYVMRHKRVSLQAAWDDVLRIKPDITPNLGFMKQLSSIELELFGARSLDLTEYHVLMIQRAFPQLTKARALEIIGRHPDDDFLAILAEAARFAFTDAAAPARVASPHSPTGSKDDSRT